MAARSHAHRAAPIGGYSRQSFRGVAGILGAVWLGLPALSVPVPVSGSLLYVQRIQAAFEVMTSQERAFVASVTDRISDKGCGAYLGTGRIGLDCGLAEPPDCGWTGPIEDGWIGPQDCGLVPVRLGALMTHEAQHLHDYQDCVAYVGAVSESRAIYAQVAFLERHGRWILADELRAVADGGLHGDPTNSVWTVKPGCERVFNPATGLYQAP